MCILVFSAFRAEISELKDEKTRMHNVHPGSHPLRSFRLAGFASWLVGVSSWLAGVFSWLAEVSSWLAGVSSWLSGVVRCEAGGVRCEA